MMVAAIVEAEVEQEAGHAVEGSEAPASLEGTPVVGEADVTEAPSVETQVAPTEGNVVGVPI